MKVVVSFSLESEVCAGIDQLAAHEGHTRSRVAEHLLRAGLAVRQQQSATETDVGSLHRRDLETA
jgi:predicted transcriptional regulator